MATSRHISEIYAAELEELAQGYPLWYPDGHDGADDIDIGDVGYITEGAFVELFKSKYRYDEPENTKNLDNIPPSHEPLPPKAYSKVLMKEDWMDPNLYASRSVKHKRIAPAAGAEAPLVGGASVHYEFSISEERGALLYITHNAVKKTAQSNRELIKYMKQHHGAWGDHARNSAGIDIRPRDVIMVQGFVKTVEFTVAAGSSGAVSQGGGISVTGGFQAVGNVSLELKHQEMKQQSVQTRSGPKKRSDRFRYSYSLHGGMENGPGYDQCLFLRYFQVRWRFPGYTHIQLRAGAGPHQLPKDPNAGEDAGPSGLMAYDGSDDEIELNIPHHSTHTWVDILLEYLLQNSDAKVAIASHGDVYSLFPENQPPKDFREHLQLTNPKVHVDEDQVATLDLLDLINQHRIQQAISEVDPAPATEPEDPDEPREDDARKGKNGWVGYGALLLASTSEAVPWAHVSMTSQNTDAVAVSSMTVSPDGSRIAASFDDEFIQVWDAKNGKLLLSLDILRDEVNRDEEVVWALCFSADGKRLLSGGVDGKVLLWTLQAIPDAVTTAGEPVVAGDFLSIMEGHESSVWTLSFSPDEKTIASGSVDGVVNVWSVPDATDKTYPVVGQCLHTFPGHNAHVISVIYTADNTRLISFAEMVGKVWSLETGSAVASMKGHTGSIWGVAASHEGDRIMTSSDDNTCRIWDIETGDELVTLGDHTGPVWSVAWSPDDKNVLAGSWDGTATISDSYTGEKLHVLSRDSAVIGTVAWSPLGDIVCTGSENGMVRLWDPHSGEFVAEFQGHVDKVKNITFTPDGQDIFTGSDDGSIRHWCISDAMRLR
ncbi:WD40 repeat-like protein [Trametopsis cervina]|nr:WD40 repeat-like protein [Trametopsis cervina]